jgi:tRNA (adenine37-N6)-methyltransferase
MAHVFHPIGLIRSCFTEKFGVPRQPLMVAESRAVLKLNAHSGYAEALGKLDSFSHIWIVFVFHQNKERPWRPTIEAPRLGNTRKVGVFASRSPYRPNPIGISVVKLEWIDFKSVEGIELHLSGVDLLDGTPVLDVKPYLPYADRVDDATPGWADEVLQRYPVEFSEQSLETLANGSELHPRLELLIRQMLEWDPRPTSQRRAFPVLAPETEGREFAFRILGLDVHWQIRGAVFYVLRIGEYPFSTEAGVF